MEHVKYVGRNKKVQETCSFVLEGYRQKGDSRIQCHVQWKLGVLGLSIYVLKQVSGLYIERTAT